jgi:hypothetical protein
VAQRRLADWVLPQATLLRHRGSKGRDGSRRTHVMYVRTPLRRNKCSVGHTQQDYTGNGLNFFIHCVCTRRCAYYCSSARVLIRFSIVDTSAFNSGHSIHTLYGEVCVSVCECGIQKLQ